VAADLDQLLSRAYGLFNGGLHPAGTTAVASRDHNLISTATALAQVGLGWPEAVELAEAGFEITDPLAGGGPGSASEVTPGLHRLLRSLSDAGLSCAVISNDDRSGIEAFLQSHSLAHHFQGLWSAEHSPRKPNPAAVHALCDELGVAPEQCALIGDANSDLRMARDAGVAAVVQIGEGWFGAERTASHVWSWSSGRSQLTIGTWADSPANVRLDFALRALAPRTVIIRQSDRELWRGPVGEKTAPHSISLRLAPGHTNLEFYSETPPSFESPHSGARALAFALYDLRLSVLTP
jgi:HAD superfamily hydrolase (TIGR01662 family)